MNYFKLHSFCKFVNGKSSGCIYNMSNYEMIEVPFELSNIINKALTNKILTDKEKEQLKPLIEKGLGQFFEKPNYIESFHFGPNPEIKSMVQPNNIIRKCYVQLTNFCDLKCVFCDDSGNVNRRTGCKKWNNYDAKITIKEWEEVIVKLKKLGCQEIHFIGGNPFLEFEKMKSIVKIALKYGIIKYVVYSHDIDINEEILEFLSEHKFTFVGTIISWDAERYRKITCGKNVIENAINKIRDMQNRRITFIGNIIVGRFNENEVEDIISKLKSEGILYRRSFIYDKPDNEFFSRKYIDKMYDKQSEFGLVTKESISFLSEYNSCLYGQIYINISGDITPCPMMNNYKIGNIRDNGGIAACVNSSEYQNLIQMSRNRIKKCSNCGYKLNCFDCRAIEYFATNDIEGQEYCAYCREGQGK